MADAHGEAVEQGAVKKPNKPFHLTPDVAPCGRSVRRR
jgi:hypothetical protein